MGVTRTLEIVVPQMGEGLEEVLLLRRLKVPGDPVARDEPIYAMETDKADMEVESPYAGRLCAWLAEEGDTLAVGAPIARIETADLEITEASTPASRRRPVGRRAAVAGRPPVAHRAGRLLIPPRTRAYCRRSGLPAAEIADIPAATGTLMPADVDRYLAGQPSDGPATERTDAVPEPAAEALPGAAARSASPPFEERPLPRQRRVFNFRLKRSAALVVPATMIRALPWTSLRAAIDALNERFPGLPASDFDVFAHAVARATRAHPDFRSSLLGDDTIRCYANLNLGVAVQRPDGDLVTAVIPRADALAFPDFVGVARERVARALDGEDQVDETVQLHLSYVTAYDITAAVPVVVAPAVAVIFLGAPMGPHEDRQANLGVTFDHRLINGVGAARFLASIAAEVEALAAGEDHPASRLAQGDSVLAAELAAATPGEVRARLLDRVARRAATVLGVPAADLDPEVPLRTLGLSSRLALELTQRLAADLGRELPATLLWTYPTVAALAEHVAAEMGTSPGGDAGRPEGPAPAGLGLTEIETLSEEEAAALLDRELDRNETTDCS